MGGLGGSLKMPLIKAYLIVALLSTIVSIIAIVLRVVATRRSGRRFRIEDWLALMFLFLFLGFQVANLFTAMTADGRIARELLAWPDDYAVVNKLIWTSLWLYFYQQLFAKASILALYYRLFSVKPTFKWCIDALVAYHAVWITVTSLLIGLYCRPTAKFWIPDLPGSCISTGALLAVTETLNSLGDFLLVALAIFFVYALQIARNRKRKLVILFGLGVLAGIVGFVKIGLAYNDNAVSQAITDRELTICRMGMGANEGKDGYTAVALWSNIQSAVGMVCCCAPVCQPLFPAPGFWTRLMTRLGSSAASVAHLHLPLSQSATSRANNNSSAVARAQDGRHEGHRYYWLQRADGRSSTGWAWSNGPRAERGAATTPSKDSYHPQSVIQVVEEIELS